MTYNDFIQSPEFKPLYTDTLTALYPMTMEYLMLRYYNYELKYPAIVFNRLALSLFNEYQNVLKDIENSIQIRKNKSFTEDNLGKVRKTTAKDIYAQENKAKESYSGYNVEESDYRVDSGNTSTNRDSTITATDINLLYALRTLESSGKKLAWFKFEESFVKLFITLYALDI